MRKMLFLVLALSLLPFTSAEAKKVAKGKDGLSCLGNYGPMSENNEEVIKWGRAMMPKFKNRAFISGEIVQINPDRTGHRHLLVRIGESFGEVIEVVYNEKFGETPEFEVGNSLQACGDYLTDLYSEAPLKAVVHWVHSSQRPDRHPNGFMIVEGITYGRDVSGY